MLLCFLKVVEEDGKYHYVNKCNNLCFNTGNDFRDFTLMDRYEPLEKKLSCKALFYIRFFLFLIGAINKIIRYAF